MKMLDFRQLNIKLNYFGHFYAVDKILLSIKISVYVCVGPCKRQKAHRKQQ